MSIETSNAESTVFRRQERLSRLGILEEPMGYVDGQNHYQYVGSDPVGSLDPLGLAATSQPTKLRVEPVEFGVAVDLPGPFASTKGKGAFFDNYIKHPGWGVTNPVGAWVKLPDGTFEYRGKIHTDLKRLVVPKDLPPCVNRGELQKAVDAFNDRAHLHEVEAQMWFRRHLELPRHGRDVGAVEREFQQEKSGRFAPNAPWEVSELIDMYSLLQEAYRKGRCQDSPPDNTIKIGDILDELKKRSLPLTRP